MFILGKEQYCWEEMQWTWWILFPLHSSSNKWAHLMKFLHSGHRHVLMCLSMLCVSCMSMYIWKKLYMHCLKTYCEPQYVLKAYILDQLQDTGISMNVSEPRNCLTSSRRWEKKDQRKKKKERKKRFYNSSNKIQIPLTIRSAAADSLSTLVCTMQTYFPACFSWMLLIIKSPAESCW